MTKKTMSRLAARDAAHLIHPVTPPREMTTDGPRIVVEGTAPDGTPEAIRVADAPGFTLSVQWHPEWNAEADPVSRPLFRAFGAAVQDWALTRGS